jgi:predicted transcriptional regulator
VPSNRIQALKQAIHEYEEKDPQFLNPNYQPNPDEAEEHKKYLALKGDLDRAYPAAAFKQFLDKENEKRAATDRILAEAGRGPVPELLKSDEWTGEVAKAQSEPHGNEPPKALETWASTPVVAPKRSADAVMADVANTAPALPAQPKAKRGPTANMEFHHAVAKVVHSFGPKWKEHLDQIAKKLDRQKEMTPAPSAWAKRERPARSWTRAVEYYPEVVVKILDYSLKMAAKDITEKPSETLGNLR